MGNTKYNVGDIVNIDKSHEVGTIIKVDQANGSNYVVYTVRVGKMERLYTEDFLSLNRDNKVLSKLENLSMDDVNYSIELDDMIEKLIGELKIESSDDNIITLKNICKLVKYFSLRNKDDSVVINTSNIKLFELYKGFSSSKDNNANCYLFSEILNRLGIKSHCVILKNNEGKFHVSNIALIGELYYYFDLSIEKSIYIDRNDDNFIYCCSGIGSDNYYQFFEPVSLLTINEYDEKEIPSNISSSDIDFQILNSIANDEL